MYKAHAKEFTNGYDGDVSKPGKEICLLHTRCFSYLTQAELWTLHNSRFGNRTLLLKWFLRGVRSDRTGKLAEEHVYRGSIAWQVVCLFFIQRIFSL